MLISVSQLVRCWGVSPAAVLHVGAHRAEEVPAYDRVGWSPLALVDALEENVEYLEERFADRADVTVHHCIAWDTDGERMTMRRASNGESSSVLEMGTHAIEHPEIEVVEEFEVVTTRLDSLLAGDSRRFDLVVLDIQGAELRALQGLGERLGDAKWVYCEINADEVYVGAGLVGEVDEFLSEKGFMRVDTRMTVHGWGDALYVRRSSAVAGRTARRFIRRGWTALVPVIATLAEGAGGVRRRRGM